jgi:hypothetical protein
MNERIRQLADEANELDYETFDQYNHKTVQHYKFNKEKFAELIVRECVNREELLGAIARGWCSEKNSHKTMDSDLAVAIYDEVEQQIRQQFGIK